MWADTGLTPTLLLSATSNTAGWTHHWHNLTPWVGQTITLTFSVHNQAGVTRGGVGLDEVTIGSARPDLWVNKVGQPLAAVPGAPVVYTIAYGNQGGAASAASVRITDTLPGELLFVSASPAPITFSPALTWDVGDLPPHSGPFTIVVTATIAPTATALRYYTNTVSINASSLELETVNNTAVAQTLVQYRIYLPLTLKNW